jgi:hypothetical protein
MRLAVRSYGAGKPLVRTLFDRQGECGSTGGQAEELKEVLHVDLLLELELELESRMIL